MTIQEAKNQTVFYVNDGKVIESSYFDYLENNQGMDPTESWYISEEEVAAVYKVAGESFDSKWEVENFCDENDIDYSEIEEVLETEYFTVSAYNGYYGNRRSEGFRSTDRDLVEADYIRGLECQVSEKNWDAPEYFSSFEEAEENRVYWAAEKMGVDADVFLSIEKKQNIIAEATKRRQQEVSEAWEAEQSKVFEKYKNIISPITGETYKQTAARMSAAMPEKINGSTFHKLIKHIRHNG